jgi:hypothetical protein
MGGLSVTPSEILAEATALNGDVQRLNSDVEDAWRAGVDDAFMTAWTSFRDEWGAYYADLQGALGWLERFWTASALDRIAQYRSQLVAWEQKFRGAGGKTSGPAIPDNPPPVNLLGDLKWIVLGVVGIALLVRFGGRP